MITPKEPDSAQAFSHHRAPWRLGADSQRSVTSLPRNNMYNGKSRPTALTLRCAPILLPLLILIGTGLWGLDFGLHWDERPWQIGPVKTMVQSHTLLPGYYDYPSFDYWLNLLVLAPDVVTPRVGGESLIQHLLRTLDSHAYLMRLRVVYLVLASLT